MARLTLSGLVVATMVAAAPSVQSTSGVTVTFLANEGVMLSAGDTHVLMDALYVPYKTYAVPHDSTQRALREARPPFDDVDLILATHYHGDHFGPQPVAAHLRANPRAVFVASRQVIDSLRRYPPARAIDSTRTLARRPPSGVRRRETINGIAVEFLGVTHGSGRHAAVQHQGFIVEIGGRRVLHLGDTFFNEEEFAQLRLDTARIDVALLPGWAITEADSRAIVQRWIKPRHVAAIHLLDNETTMERRVTSAWPGAVAFTRSLDVRQW